jgi:hypothetical protein
MSTRARVEQLADDLAVALADLDLSVYPEPGAPGRGGLYAYVEPPTYLYETATRTYCVSGRPPRLDTSVVIVGGGTAPGQLLALYDAADALVAALDEVAGWGPSADATPGDYQGTPAYVVPVRSL